MNTLYRPGLLRTLAVLPFVLLVACTQEEIGRGDVQLPEPNPVRGNGLVLEAVSTKPWLVTGGDVLVRVSRPQPATGQSLKVTLNGSDVTGSFRAGADGDFLIALLEGLQPGDNSLVARQGSGESGTALDSSSATAKLILTNYPISGPIISGPHESPFYCQTQEFELAGGGTLGPPVDADCSIPTRVDYVYFSSLDQSFKPLPGLPAASQPNDLAQLTLPDSTRVPFIVRVETGTVNRAIYEIAMLHQPGDIEPDPFNRSAGWNGKLVYTHGGGCRGGWYQQGNSTGGVLREGLLEMGYAVVSATLNVFGQNCNDLLASETHIMVKERFIEHYGEPVYTIGTGGSGGSYQSHQTADNYPGVFDGIIVSSSFPDVTSATIFTLADARLLNHYFSQVNPAGFSASQQQAVAGFGSLGSVANLARGAARLDPLFSPEATLEEQGGEVSIEALQSRRYAPGMPTGVRATVYDHTVNVYGLAPDTRKAARPLDNTGVQYGLAALNEGVISVQQFIDLNRDIGGFDRDMNHVSERHHADPGAARKALESGRVLYGGAGLAQTPVIDYRSYTDHRENGDIHMIVHQFSTRQRLIEANGHADNHVMTVGGQWGFSASEPDLGNLFLAMDEWLMAIATYPGNVDRATQVVTTKPYRLTDNCWDNSGEQRQNVRQQLSYDNPGRCGELYPAYPTPRQVAGAPLANAIVSCQLKPVDPADYAVEISPEQLEQLRKVFDQGVCDWSRSDAHGATYQGTWLSFGPSPVNRIQ